MPKTKRSYALILLVICALFAFAACQPGDDAATATKEEATSQPTKAEATEETVMEENVTLTIMDYWEWLPEVTSDTYVLKLWGDAVNVTFDPIQVPNEDYETKQNTLLASGDIPDIMMIKDSNIWKEYGPQGIFINTTEATANGSMPNLATRFAEFPDVVETAPDGNCYAFPTYSYRLRTDNFNFHILLREDLLEAAGYDMDEAALDAAISTPDELLDALRASYEQMNLGKDEPQPIISSLRGLMRGYVFRPVLKNFGTDAIVSINNTTNEYELGPLYGNYKIALQFLNSLYTEGILHPAWLTMTEEDHVAFINEGLTGAWIGPNDWTFSAYPHVDYYKDAGDYIVLPPEINGERASMRLKNFASFFDVGNAQSENIDRIMLAMDYAYSDEGSEILSFGEEGYAWEYDEDSPWNRRWILNFTNYYPLDENGEPISDYNADVRQKGIGVEPFSYMPPRDMWFIDGMMMYLDPDLDNTYGTTDYINKLEANGLWNDTAARVLVFTEEEQDFILNNETAINTYIEEESAKFINGLRSFDEWDAFVEAIKKLGGEELEAIYNAANDRANAN
jgi:putative aldouronate transport system substrate-binding protein